MDWVHSTGTLVRSGDVEIATDVTVAITVFGADQANVTFAIDAPGGAAGAPAAHVTVRGLAPSEPYHVYEDQY
jgi:hypothetical protein